MILPDSTMKKMTGQKGVATVEFAIVLPLLIVLVFGIIEFSILFYNKAMITNASREGARAGIVYGFAGGEYHPLDEEEIKDVICAYLSDRLITFGSTRTCGTESGNNPLISISWEGGPPPVRGGLLTVNVGYDYTFLVIPNFVTDLAGGLTLEAETVMRME